MRTTIACLHLWVAGILLASFSASSYAQGLTRQVVPKGNVSGLEMGIEGSMHTLPGGELRWFVTVYEVVKGRSIRPASGVELRVQTSFHRQGPVSQAVSDSRGQAALSFSVPASLKNSFHLIVEARSPKGVQRDFEVQVAIQERYFTELHTERERVLPKAQFRVWGRVIDLVTHLPVAGRAVSVHSTAGSQRLAHRELETDAQGIFQTLLHAPKNLGAFVVNAQTKDAKLASRTVQSIAKNTAPLQVLAEASKAVVTPGTTVPVHVVVRRQDGRPVAGAVLSGLSIPSKEENSESFVPLRTDRFGRATVPWTIQSRSEVEEVVGKVQALREGIGKGEGRVSLRASRASVLVSWAVEGGTLVAGVPNRIVLRAFHPSGEPWANLPIELESFRIKGNASQTNDAGLAILDVTLGPKAAKPTGECEGSTQTALRLIFAQGHKQLCLPVDPDATMRVQAPSKVIAGAELSLRLLRQPSVQKSAIAVTVLSKSKEGRWIPLVRKVAAPGADSLRLDLPDEARGGLWVRARPLVGPLLQPVRGGSTMTWAATAHSGSLDLIPSANGDIELPHRGVGEQVTGIAFALPHQEGQALLERLGKERGGVLSAHATEEEWLGFLAAQTPVDHAVSATLSEGRIRIMVMPEDASSQGLLRDPWRTQQRFVGGRLARVMLAVEDLLEEHLPENLDHVARRGPKGWRFNREVIAAVRGSIGNDSTTDLAGEQLDIKELQALASDFVFDNVARRLTRERLLQNLVFLREFVKREELDYQWEHRGDPSGWLTALLRSGLPLEREQLYDGWGKVFSIRKAPGKRARFQFLEPIVGYELISAGPDGRFGTRDDMFDPFARILSSKSLYGEAVGEEALLARLRGVALGRATLSALKDEFGVEVNEWTSSELRGATHGWQPMRKVGKRGRTSVVRDFEDTALSLSVIETLKNHNRLTIALSPQLRRYLVVGGIYAQEGASLFGAEALRAGAPVHVASAMPRHLRPQESLHVPLQILGLAKTEPLRIHLQAHGLHAELVGASTFQLDAGEVLSMDVALRAKEAGVGQLRIEVKTSAGVLLRALDYEIPVLWHGALRAQHTGVVVKGKAKLSVKAPKGTRPIRSLLVVSQPQYIDRDPGFAQLRRQHPELFAWAASLRGTAPGASQLQALRLNSGQGQYKGQDMKALRQTCAALAWSSLAETDDLGGARKRAIEAFGSVKLPTSMRERSAMLVALAGTASSLAHGAEQDTVTAMVERLRADGWHAPHSEKGNPTLMARLAAGLLLADPRDLPGRELFRLARAALVGKGGDKTLRGVGGQTLDGWIGTLALSIAARQLGEDALVAELRKGLVRRLYLGMQGQEPGFWLLAASAYGVFGAREASKVVATWGGERHTLRFEAGVAVVALPRAGAAVQLESQQPLVARAEARYVRPVEQASAAALLASISGDVGSAADIATLELVVKNVGKERIAHPVVEIMLPSAAVLEPSRLLALQTLKRVARVEPVDGSGLLRLHLMPIDPKDTVRVPLALRWIGHGKVRGLSISSFDAGQPWLISSTQPRSLSLSPAVVETW